MTMENPANPEHPKEKHIFLEMAEGLRSRALKARHEAELSRSILQRCAQAIADQEISPEPNKNALTLLRMQYELYVRDVDAWADIADRFERMAQGYEAADAKLRN
jgi:hypothetical protein